jgi:hypothetical protein
LQYMCGAPRLNSRGSLNLFSVRHSLPEFYLNFTHTICHAPAPSVARYPSPAYSRGFPRHGLKNSIPPACCIQRRHYKPPGMPFFHMHGTQYKGYFKVLINTFFGGGRATQPLSLTTQPSLSIISPAFLYAASISFSFGL